MVGVGAAQDSTAITIFGHGLRVGSRFEISPSVWVTPEVPVLDVETTAKGCRNFIDYAAAVHGHRMATFCLEISEPSGGEPLAVRAWNALWMFHLLAVASGAPSLMLYAMSDGVQPVYSALSRTPLVGSLPKIKEISSEHLIWARQHHDAFEELLKAPEFAAAIRCYMNAFYLQDDNVRIMLLWAGIEGLLSVDAELSRRLALYAALILDGPPSAKARYFDFVKCAYGTRSRAVHGGTLKPDKLSVGCDDAAGILIMLLARCVELGRVPDATELDRLALRNNLC